MPHWTIDKVSIAGGFLGEFSVLLPPGMVCVIGPRGSGKSTLAEALRIALGGVPPGINKPRQEFIRATLGGAILTVTTAAWPDRGAITVRRVVGQDPTVTGADGRQITAVELDRGTFLPLDAYSGAEIEAIADENIGARRKALLDDLSQGELHLIHLGMGEQVRALEANADAIAALQRRIANLTEQMEELRDARSLLEALPPSPESNASPEFQAAAFQHACNEKEESAANVAIASLRKFEDAIARAVEVARADFREEILVAGSANVELISKIDIAIREGAASMTRIALEAVATASGAREVAAVGLGALAAAHADQGVEYARQQDLNRQATQAYESRHAAERSVASLENLTRQREAAEADLATLMARRIDLRTEYVLTRERISEVRERVAEQLQAQAGQKVRIRVQRNADTLHYQERLTAALTGSNLRNQGDILAALTKVRPEDLAQIVRDADADELEAQTSLGRERGRKVLESLRLNEDPMKLEIIGTEDKICIELNVATGPDPNFKDASELSRGQKCTALLPILLARQNSPLVIDQPEDNLDNHFIYETVVGTIHRQKSRRQMIFITHNANIPVLGGADLVIVMNSDGRRGFIQKSGTVDERRKEIIDLLEGGEEAFELRRKRYGRR